MNEFSSPHCTFEGLAPGIFAAIAIKGGGAFSNAGIIDLGDQTLIFDTFETPQAAEDLRAAAKELTGRRGSLVINSHWHADHWLGNQVFAPGATILATHATRAHMCDAAAEYQKLQANPSEIKTIIAKEQARLAATTDPARRLEVEYTVSRWQHTLEGLPNLDLRLPQLTFEGKLVFHGTRRTAELISWGAGHTRDDCFLVLPADRIAFLGDLAFFQRQPFMVHCDPVAWVAHLERLEAAGIDTFVPGHGPVGTVTEMTLQKRYIVALHERVAKAIAAGEVVEQVLSRRLPSPFDAWSLDGLPSEPNVRALYTRFLSERS